MKSVLFGLMLSSILIHCVYAQVQESVDVELVETYVAALDSDGNPVTDLSANDFAIKEDGVEQSISYFTRILDEESQIPLTVAFLLDTSGSMGKGDKITRIEIARQFADFLMKELKPADQMRVYGFDNIYRALTPMTSDVAAIQKSLANVKIDTEGNPGTALLASVDLTIQQLETYFGRKIIVICSDGQNNIAGPTPEILIEKLKKNDITVISLGTESKEQLKEVEDGINRHWESSPEAREARKLLKDLAEQTNGRSFFVGNVSGLNTTIEKIRSLIRSQYSISYKPKTEGKSGWHKIDVQCKKKGVKLQYRNGYYIE